MPAQVPAIPELIVFLDQLNPVALGQTQLIRTPRLEVVHDDEEVSGPGVRIGTGPRHFVGVWVRRKSQVR